LARPTHFFLQTKSERCEEGLRDKPMLERATKDRAIKLLRMMETTNENERAAAATMLLKLANAHKMNLVEFVEAFGEKPLPKLEQTDWDDSD
jgi:hypothetical protein